MNSSFKWPASVTYCAANELPIRRVRSGKGFTYRNSAGDRVADVGVLLRIDSLAIPPAWEDVRIAGVATWHIQAIGRDARDRKQYRYNPRWIEQNKLRDFERLVSFAASLPTIREYIDGQLRRRRIDKERVTGIALHLLDRTLIRVGNTAYAELNGSFGLTTLRAKHLKLDDESIKLSFIGKGGKARKLSLEDPRAARALRHCHELPGQQLLQYRSETGDVLSLTSSDINEALCSMTGESFTAKTFRTWGASSDAFERLVEAGPADTDAEAKRTLNDALRATAAVLGNTLAVCRKYYVHPAISESYLGNGLPHTFGRARNGLSAAESATVRFLEQL